MKVEIYNCKVRHGGATCTVLHEIPKTAVTFKELQLLRYMHGEEQVVDIVSAGNQEIDEKEELLLLARQYSVGGDRLSGKRLVEKVFSTSLHEYDKWLSETEELERMAQEERHAIAQREINMLKEAQESSNAAIIRKSVPAAQAAR